MIELLYVHNYRCFENLTLDLTGSSSALLIGKNGAGKSTVLHCLRLFQEICRGSSRVGKLISENDFTRHRFEIPIRFVIHASLDERRFKYAVSFEWPERFREARILEESLTVDGVSIFMRERAEIQLGTGAKFGLDWHVLALPVINEPAEERTIQDVRSYFASLILIAPIPARMTGYSEEPTLELDGDAANYASCLRALLGHKPAAYGVFESHLRTAIPDFASIENVERGESGTQLMVNFQDKKSGRSLTIEFKSLSDGEKCFFLCALIVALTSVRSHLVCVWDEPDNHLSLPEVGQFVVGLRKMSGKRVQFIATSHHPETIRKFSDENTLVLTRESSLDPTKVASLASHSYQGDLIDALIRDDVIGQP